MKKKLQIFILCLSFFSIFDSISFSKNYDFKEYGISFSIPDNFSCKTTKVDQEIKVSCKHKGETIFFGLSKNPSHFELENLYKIQEKDYKKANAALKVLENGLKGIKIKEYIISPIFNTNMILGTCYMDICLLDIKFCKYYFFTIGITKKLSSLIILMGAESTEDENSAKINFEKFKKKYLKEIIFGIIVY